MHHPRITLDWLNDHGVQCKEPLAVFRACWPDGAELSPENIRRAAEIGLDLGWLACELLSEEQVEEFRIATRSAWQKYRRETNKAWREYARVTGPAFIDVVGH